MAGNEEIQQQGTGEMPSGNGALTSGEVALNAVIESAGAFAAFQEKVNEVTAALETLVTDTTSNQHVEIQRRIDNLVHRILQLEGHTNTNERPPRFYLTENENG